MGYDLDVRIKKLILSAIQINSRLVSGNVKQLLPCLFKMKAEKKVQ